MEAKPAQEVATVKDEPPATLRRVMILDGWLIEKYPLLILSPYWKKGKLHTIITSMILHLNFSTYLFFNFLHF